MKFEIKNRWSGNVQFACELSAEIADKSYGLRLGFAVREAIKADADLTGADLTGADLTGADLTDADLTGADLTDAVLTDAVLTGADLTDADLTDAVLTGADLTGADLTDAVLTDADLTGADLTGADLTGAHGVSAPIIPNIDDTILSNINAPGCSLDMSRWHVCGTTHCRAGWAVHLAGEGGKALEDRIGTGAAGALIYHASAGYIPNFYAGDADAMEDIVAHATQQRGGMSP